MALGLAKVAPDLPKDGLRAVLGFLADNWKTVGRASLVSKTWKVTIAAMESSVWQAALRARWHGYRASRVAGPHVGAAEALATCKSIAGLVVAPRRVHDDAVLLRDQSCYGGPLNDCRAVCIGGLMKSSSGLLLHDFLVEVKEAKIKQMNAFLGRKAAIEYAHYTPVFQNFGREYVIPPSLEPFLEATAAIRFLRELAGKGNDVSVGARMRGATERLGRGPKCDECGIECFGESYFLIEGAYPDLDYQGLCPKCADPDFKEKAILQHLERGKAMPAHQDTIMTGFEAKDLLANIAHDLLATNTFQDVFRVQNASEMDSLSTRSTYGITREVLRGVFLDDSFAPGKTNLAKELQKKMSSWSFFVSSDSFVSELCNVNQRNYPEECPPERPTTHFFPGIQFNGDPLGAGSLLIALEHDLDTSSDFGHLFQYPVKSIVVLAERAGMPTCPWKPGDGGFYEDDPDADY